MTTRRPRIGKSPAFFWLACCCVPFAVQAQSPASEVGRPFIRGFSPKEIGNQEQFWSAVQDRRGVMYFGGNTGVSEYDGVSWRTIASPVARSLAIDAEGRIYVGCQGNLGYLAPGPSGQLRFESLLDRVPSADRAFGDVWRTFATPEGVYFQSSDRLFRWSGGRVRVWRPSVRFVLASYVRGRLYVGDAEAGMLRLEGDSLQPLAGFRRFTQSFRVQLFPYGKDKLLVADAGPRVAKVPFDAPLFLYDGVALTRFPTSADSFPIQHRIYSGAVLGDGSFAFGTIGGGLVVFDPQGRLVRVIDKPAGLRDRNVFYVFPDREGALWLGLDSGIARVETPSPISWYGPESGIAGELPRVVRHLGSLYLATGQGAFLLDVANGQAPRFRPVSGLAPLEQTFMLASMKNGPLLLAAGSGLYEVRGDRAVPIRVGTTAQPFEIEAVVVSKQHPNRVFVGLASGVAALRLEAGKWTYEGKIAGDSHDVVDNLLEAKAGELWAGTEASGLLRVDLGSVQDSGSNPVGQTAVERFGPAQGLSPGGINAYLAGGKPIFTSTDWSKVYRFNESSRRFIPDPTFAVASSDPTASGLGFQEDANGNVWTQRGRELVFMAKQKDGSWTPRRQPFLHSGDFGGIVSAYPEENGVTWFGTSGGAVIRYDSNLARRSAPGFTALVRRVSLSGGAVLFEGDGAAARPRLPAASNALRFEFAAPTFADESANEFQQYLEGLDKGWSGWSKETKRDFTNLPFGDFRFHVRARDGYGQIGAEDVYEFLILPPWYRTWWTYGAYALIFAGAFWASAGIQRRRATLRERERARVRTEALEAQTRALNAEKELLSEFGKDNTSLDFDSAFLKLYDHLKDLCDAAVFRAGKYRAAENRIEYSLAMERGNPGAPVSIDLGDDPQGLEATCIASRQALMVTDAPSRICVPLLSHGTVNGLVFVQSSAKDAYTDYHLQLLQNLTAYALIALENADARRQLNSTLENLEHTVEERTREIRQLSDIGKEITASLDLETILFRLYENVNRLADASLFEVGICVPEEHRIDYRLTIEKGRRREPYSRDTLDKNQFAVWCIENQKPVVMNDVQKEYPRYIARLDEITGPGRPESMICLPLITQHRVLGVISIQSFRKNAYSDYDVDLLRTLAAYTSIALDNATAYRRLDEREREVRQRAAELATVNAVGQALGSKLEVQSLIELVGDKVREVFHAQIAYVALLDKAAGLIRFPYGYGDDFPVLPLGEGLTSRILLSGEPLLINEDLAGSHRRLGIARVGTEAASYLGVPISAGGETVGVISVQTTDTEGRFTPDDLRLLGTIAANVGVALHNARLFEETAQARAVAEEADAAKSAFLSTVSHELRTPLTSVLGFAKIIRRRLAERIYPLLPQDDKKTAQTMRQVTENLDVVVSEGERLTKLIDEVLDLAKIESGKLEWRMETVTAAEIVKRAMAATSSLVENRSVTLIEDIAPGLPSFTGDRDRLIQVVINLISNAVKFTKEGSVTCRARQEGAELVVSVVDTGVGISAADQPKVFEKFKQVGDTLTDKPKGTGLGLPICKEIVEHHEGRIWVESEPGKGSTFSFSIPVKAAAPEAEPLQSLDIESIVRRLRERVNGDGAVHGRRTDILVVDDDPHIRELLQQEFQEAGHSVRLAANGREALEQVRVAKPGLVVLDVMMPEMNGFDVAAVLKNDPETMDIPIIMLSILQDKERGHRLGIDRYLTKPIDTELLFREVDTLVEQGKSRKKVMVVDEDASTVGTLAEVLKVRGYHVVESSGNDLMHQARTSKPDVIILNSVLSAKEEIMQTLRFEKGLENVLFLIYQ